MKTLRIIILGALLIVTTIFGANAFASETNKPVTVQAECEHYFVSYTDAQGNKWIIEYDCDGNVVQIRPDWEE